MTRSTALYAINRRGTQYGVLPYLTDRERASLVENVDDYCAIIDGESGEIVGLTTPELADAIPHADEYSGQMREAYSRCQDIENAISEVDWLQDVKVRSLDEDLAVELLDALQKVRGALEDVRSSLEFNF